MTCVETSKWYFFCGWAPVLWLRQPSEVALGWKKRTLNTVKYGLTKNSCVSRGWLKSFCCRESVQALYKHSEAELTSLYEEGKQGAYTSQLPQQCDERDEFQHKLMVGMGWWCWLPWTAKAGGVNIAGPTQSVRGSWVDSYCGASHRRSEGSLRTTSGAEGNP